MKVCKCGEDSDRFIKEEDGGWRCPACKRWWHDINDLPDWEE